MFDAQISANAVLLPRCRHEFDRAQAVLLLVDPGAFRLAH
ncbi:MAG: hypothetical protein ACI9IV_001139 [Paracoccaceae bacterium]|jgi:hypothetical protein